MSNCGIPHGLRISYQRVCYDRRSFFTNDYEEFRKVLPSKLFEYGAINKPILAGISGYSEEFAKSELCNCAVFSPTDPEHAVIINSNL